MSTKKPKTPKRHPLALKLKRAADRYAEAMANRQLMSEHASAREVELKADGKVARAEKRLDRLIDEVVSMTLEDDPYELDPSLLEDV